MKTESILDLVGNTPLVKMNRMSEFKKAAAEKTECLFKLEYFNPLQSVKDRIAKAMIVAAEKDGSLKPGMTILEPTSGNTGIGLAFACAAKGYKLKLVMPETMSYERRTLLLMLGAEVILTPGPLSMRGAIAKAMELHDKDPNSFMPRQFENPANPQVHYETTGPEIWKDTGGKIDILICGVGTGGTLTGTSRFLKEKNPKLEVIAVEPAESAVISGEPPNPHKIQGIGAGFIPKNLDRSYITGIEKVSSSDAMATARRVLTEEGIPAGISSGAAVCAAARVAAKDSSRGKTIVTVLASATERYLSTPFAEDARKKALALVTTDVGEDYLKRAVE